MSEPEYISLFTWNSSDLLIFAEEKRGKRTLDVDRISYVTPAKLANACRNSKLAAGTVEFAEGK